MSPWTTFPWTTVPWTNISLDNCPLDKSCNTDFTADCVINSINIQIIYKEIAIRADYKSGAPVHCLSQAILKINPTFDYFHISNPPFNIDGGKSRTLLKLKYENAHQS